MQRRDKRGKKEAEIHEKRRMERNIVMNMNLDMA
jgi:hypothetical protein